MKNPHYHVSTVFPVLLLITFSIVPLCAHADRAKAKLEYEEAARRYDLNEFPAALQHFKQAYLEYEEPTFLFNIAQCYRQLGDKQQALLFYRSYLRKLPDAPNADEVHQLTAHLEAAIAKGSRMKESIELVGVKARQKIDRAA